MRRLFSAVAVAAVIAGLLAPGAEATTNSVVFSYSGLGAGWQNASIDCSSSAAVSLTAAHVAGPATPPAGRGSLRISESSGVSGGIQEDFSQTEPNLSTLSAFDTYLYSASSGGVGAALLIEAYDPSTNLDYELSLPLSVPDQWIHLDAASSTLSWQSWNDTTGASVGSGSDTLANFVAARTNAVLDQLVVAGSCDPGAFYVDWLHYATGTSDQTVDFDVPDVTTLSHAISTPSSVPIGTTITISTQLRNVSKNLVIPGNKVSLWSRAAGASSYHLVWSGLTNYAGRASRVLTVSTTTTYQWRFGGIGAEVAPSSSAPFVISTHYGVAISAKPAQAGYRAKALIKGRVTPGRAGIIVRLVRVVAGRQTIVATVRTTTGGYFTMYAPMTVRGTATYVLRALAYPGEPTRQSFTFKIVTI